MRGTVVVAVAPGEVGAVVDDHRDGDRRQEETPAREPDQGERAPGGGLMARGNPDNLRAAAERKHAEAVERAQKAINALVRDGARVNFRAVARVADCSPDFIYRTPALRERIEGLRAAPARGRAAPPAELERSPSNVLRELAAQLADERRRREEVAALEAALAAAHGELLDLRRRASARHVA